MTRVHVIKTLNGYKADCSCGWAIETIGHDAGAWGRAQDRVAAHHESHEVST